MKPYFERLEQAGFIRKGRLQEKAVINAPFSKVLDLIDAVASDTAKIDTFIRPSIHTHCASLGLGGARDECWHIGCRTKQIDELAHYAALYSDRVFIHNFLTDFAPTLGHAPNKDSIEFRSEVVSDILILLRIRTLIEKDRIVVYTPSSRVCPWCYYKRTLGSEAAHRLTQAVKSLSQDLFKQASVDIKFEEELDEFALFFQTPAGLFDHDRHITVRHQERLPPAISSKPRLMNKIQAGGRIPLSGEAKRKLGLHTDMANMVIRSLGYQTSVANAIGTSYLTSRNIDVNILKYVTGDAELEQTNRVAAQHLQAMVPFAGDVPISRLMQLRQREEESFIRFRSALDTAIKETTSQTGLLTERDARMIYSDVLAPEIARLDQKVREAKRDLVKVPLTSAVATAAVVIFGLYTGVVPSELKEIAAVLGLTKVVYDTVMKSAEYADAEKSIRPEKFYFLWKVKHLGKATR